MYDELTTKELEFLIEQTKRELTALRRYYERGDYSLKGFETQVNLLLDDLDELKKELNKRI